MKVFGFLSQKTIKVQFSKFRKISMDFILSQTINMGGKKSTSEAQKRSLYVKMFYFQQRLKKK